MPSISYPCLTCPRDEDYCHETCQDQHCPAWQAFKRTILLWLIATKQLPIQKKEVTQDAQQV